MRVVKQIIYEADTEQEAFEKARKKLGPEAVVLSSIPVKRGGFLRLFKKKKIYSDGWYFGGRRKP